MTNPLRVSRDALKRFLNGHRAAGVRLREEALRRLASLSVEDARAEYDSLCHVWEMSRVLGDESALDRRAIQERVALRRRFGGQR